MNNQDNIQQGEDAARGVVSDAEGDVARAPAQQEQDETEDGQETQEQSEAQESNPSDEDPNPHQQQQQQQQQQQLQPFSQQQQQQQQMPSFPPSWPHPMNPLPNPSMPPNAALGGVPQPPPPPSQHAIAMAQYYEARMRDHAAAYASAAAGAAWAAAQIAAQAAEFAACTHATNGYGLPPPEAAALPPPHVPFDPQAVGPPALPMPPGPGMYYPQDPAANGSFYPGAMVPLGPQPAGMDPNNFYYPNANSYPQQAYQHEEEEQEIEGGDDPQPPHHHWQHNDKRDNHNKHHHDDDNNNDDDVANAHDNDDSYEYRNNRRKRMQRRPPGGISIPRHTNRDSHQNLNSANNSSNNNNNNNGSRVRRRLRDEHSSNSSCCSGSLGTSITSYNSDQAMGGGHNSNSGNYAGHGNSSSSGGHRGGKYHRGGGRGSGGSGSASGSQHYHRFKKKQRQPPSDASLFGKTAVAAFHEWCNKRRMGQPSFALLSQVSREGGGGGDFEMAVYMEDGVEIGRGKGTSKASAKQDAARKALMALLPGVVFDPESGILVELPDPSPMVSPNAAIGGRPSQRKYQRGPNPETSASLEDLAPHLAQRLAIASGRDDDCDEQNGKAAKHTASRQRPGPYGAVDYSSKKLKRAWNVYPGTTSTTNSEEEDENAWYASRGASVCSALLHAMVQIDDRIPEGPQYTFVMSEMQTTNAQMKRKGPASSSCGSAIVIHRGSFTCTATLKVLYSTASNVGGGNDSSNSPNERKPAEPKAASVLETGKKKGQARDGPEKGQERRELSGDSSNIPRAGKNENTQVSVLEAVGVGGTKRESKHTASAKLLAMLFPECKTMVEVKAAAEAAREEYAANKSKKQQSNRNIANANNRRRYNRRDRSKIPRLSLSQLNAICAPGEHDPPLPDFYAGELQALLGIQQQERPSSTICSQVMSFEKLNLNQDATVESGLNPKLDTSDEACPLKSGVESSECAGIRATSPIPRMEHTSLCRQLSRQKQLEEKVDRALQALNEHDEEGRSLPEEITVDDVGRTVLRRAETEDIERIRRLLRSDESRGAQAVGQLSPVSILGAAASGTDTGHDNEASGDDGAISLCLWGSSTIVLLLCRAIAAFEDPPLGCAVLTLGFSMKRGRLLRVAQMGSEPHLPRERFLECLDAFAASMNCTLERQGVDGGEDLPTGVRLQKRDLEAIVESHLGLRISSPASCRTSDEGRSANFSVPLQSVLEESEGSNDSDRSTDASRKVKGRDKPCKRSRVE